MRRGAAGSIRVLMAQKRRLSCKQGFKDFYESLMKHFQKHLGEECHLASWASSGRDPVAVRHEAGTVRRFLDGNNLIYVLVVTI